MNFWQQFWTVVFFGSLAIFAIISVVVAIGGFGDVKTMLRALKEGSSEEAED